LKVAIVHYWLVGMRGGEKVVESLCEMFPQADIFTHVHDPAAVSETINRHRIFTTFIQKLPGARTRYKKYLLLMPFALEALNLQDYDLVISSESGPAKGVITRPDALHICYCHSPMRYIWDQYHEYRAAAALPARWAMSLFATPLRVWDVAAAARVDAFIANSSFVAGRISKYYRRAATVIHPPVAVESFTAAAQPDDFYLCFGHLAAYKRFDLAVDAFNMNGKKLIIAGDGEEAAALRRLAQPNVTFVGRQTPEAAKNLLANCRALIFPGVEDFGIVPLEAMASGRPVIAYGKGGALDTMTDGETGVLFHEPTAAALNDAIMRFEAMPVADPQKLRAHAMKFDAQIFKEKLTEFIDGHLTSHRGSAV
jgi:glycosyltransferase involved in cell wall biosynthesis